MKSAIPLFISIVFIPLTLAHAEGEQSKPNIVFIFADDQRHDTLGCAGHPVLKTPNIDEMARTGVRFENALVTTSICWISRASVLTGMWSRSHGTKARVDRVTPEAAANIYPKVMRAAGYKTAFYGKWHAKMPPGFKNQEHFDSYEGIGRNPYFKKQPDGSKRHETDLIGDRAVEFINAQDGSAPFCINLWFNAGHAEDGDKRPGVGHFPWPPSTDGMYEDQEMPAPRLNDPKIFESQPDFLKKSINRERFFWRWDTPEKYRTNMRAYLRMISGIDQVVGRVRSTLQEKGFSDDTIIVYSADNGYYMGDRGFAGKWSHYEQSIRVPLVIHDPRLPAKFRGQVNKELVLNVDLPSTFLDVAGIPQPDTYEGTSLMPLVRGETEGWREDALLEHLLPAGARIPKWEGVRTRRYMYARYFENDYEFLHDLETDPDQIQNFANDEEYADTLRQLRQRCDELVEKYGGKRGGTPQPPAKKPTAGQRQEKANKASN